MPTALELFYQNKAEGRKASPVLARRMEKELAGAPDMLKKHSPGFFIKLLDLLDRPGNATRALLIGKLGGLKGLIPFAQVIENLTGWDVALNKDELVRGVNVIEKLFGKQRQRKGKIDLVDVLGLLVEVVADPLWLVGGLGLTKVGRAKKLAQAGLRGIKTGTQDIKTLRNIIKLAKSGKTIPKGPAKRMTKAFRTVYEAGQRPTMARTWAEQAARGERAFLKLGLPGKRVPVIKGVPFWKGAEKVSKYLKKGPLGRMFLAPTRRVSDRYAELHDISVHLARDLPAKEQGRLMQNLQKLGVDLSKIEDLAVVDEKLAKFIEANFAEPHIIKRIARIKAERAARAIPKIAKAGKEIEAVKKQAVTQLKRFEEAKKVPFRPKPVVPGKKPALKLKQQGPLGVWEEQVFLLDSKQELSSIVSAVRANEGDEAANIVRRLLDKGIDTTSTHRAKEGIIVRVRNLSNENRAILEKTPGVHIKQYEKIGGDYITFGKDFAKGRIVRFKPKTQRGLLRDVNRELRGHPLYVQELDNIADQYSYLIDHMGKIKFDKTDMGNVLQLLDQKRDMRRRVWKYIAKPSESATSWDKYAMQLTDAMGVEQITDVDEFIRLFDEGLRSAEKSHGLNRLALSRLDKIQEPGLQMLLTKRQNILVGKTATQINADLVDMAKHYGGTQADVRYLLVPQKGKALPTQRELTARWRWQTSMDKARARAKTQRIEGRLDVILKRKATLEKRIGRWEKGARREDIKSIQFAKERGVKLKAEAAEILETVPEAGKRRFGEAARALEAEDARRLVVEQAAKVPVSEIDNLLGYQRRLLTPQARDFLNDLKMQEQFLSRARAFSVRAPSQRRRSKALGMLTRDEVQDVFKNIGFEGQVFEPGALASAMARGTEHARVVGSAKTIHAAVKKFSKTQQWVDDMTRMKKPVEDMIDLQDFMVKTGLVVQPGEYAGRVIPKEIAVALGEMSEVMSSSDVTRGFWKHYTDWQRYLKGAFTMPFPAYHGRNALSNFFQNWITDVKNPVTYYKAVQLQKAVESTYKLMKSQNKLWDEAAGMVDWPMIYQWNGRQFWDLADSWGVVEKSLGQVGVGAVAGAVTVGPKAKSALVRHFKGQGPLWQRMKRFSMIIEDNARLAHFIDKMGKGFDAQAASRSAKTALFDYGDLSQWEKKWARDRIFFFYTFMRKNFELQTKTLFQQPAKQAFFSHLAGGTPRMQKEAKAYPDYWQERLVIPIPGTEKEGVESVIAGVGLPIEEAFGPLAGPGVGPLNRLRRIVSRGASRLSPMVTTPTEFITQRHLYFDKPIRRWGEWGVQKSPAGRFYGTYKSLRYGRDVPGSRVTGTLTGMRYKPFNLAEQTEYKAKRIAREYLAKQKEARTFKRYYVPAEQKQDLSPDIQEALKAQ